MGRLIDDLMDVSRINQGRIELRRAWSTLARCWPTPGDDPAADRRIRPGADGAAAARPHAVVDADRTRLAQVFMNLLNNAAKYTDRGGRIEVRVVTGRRHVVVSVRDNGIGIPPHRLEACSRCSRRRSRAVALARRPGHRPVADAQAGEMHGGTSRAQRRPGQGQPVRGAPAAGRGRRSPETAAAVAGRKSPESGGGAAHPGGRRQRRRRGHAGDAARGDGARGARVHDGEAAVQAAASFDPSWCCWTSACPS
jgi:hypothetical protein